MWFLFSVIRAFCLKEDSASSVVLFTHVLKRAEQHYTSALGSMHSMFCSLIRMFLSVHVPWFYSFAHASLEMGVLWAEGWSVLWEVSGDLTETMPTAAAEPVPSAVSSCCPSPRGMSVRYKTQSAEVLKDPGLNSTWIGKGRQTFVIVSSECFFFFK